MFDKILIANRGEIACRIIKTAKRMGITTVAIFSDIDSQALHVRLADEAYCLGGATAQESYLNIVKIIDIAKRAQVDAIHPGYGFLSENAEFAKACSKNNIEFIGPSIEALNTMGSKQLAKVLLEKHQVPLVPGYHGEQQDSSVLLEQARAIGFPVLLKAASGGGGKGMRAVHAEAEFIEALNSAKREAKSSFDDDTMIIEKLIQNPRHIEMQVFADKHANAVYLFERDCSIQRRHQKIIEEAPATNMPDTLRQQMGEAALAVARAINYIGAGTVEFLLDSNDNSFYFMEMNTRLQVEHPVTEMITGVDLVEWQILTAQGEILPKTQQQLHITGHAIEARIYAEDPKNNFLPSIGKIVYLNQPEESSAIRIDTGVNQNDNISMYYDPMIAKLITWGESRQVALKRMSQALSDYHVCGVKTNIDFLQSVISLDAFKQARITTSFLQENDTDAQPQDQFTPLLLASCYELLKLSQQKAEAIHKDAFCWQSLQAKTCELRFEKDGQIKQVIAELIKANLIKLEIDNEIVELKADLCDNRLSAFFNEQRLEATIIDHNDELDIFSSSNHWQLMRYRRANTYLRSDGNDGQLTAPMPGTVVAILKETGETVGKGDSLMVIEAMKMEHTIHAPIAGELKFVFYKVGDQVNEGDELVAIDCE